MRCFIIQRISVINMRIVEIMTSEDEMKKVWTIEIEQNGGEYSGQVYITAEKVDQTDRFSIIADGIEIVFDEEIIEIK